MKSYKKLLLIILDGFGFAPPSEHNAIYKAKTPFFDSVLSKNPYAKLEASGTAVGSLKGQIGTSEVGHMSIGAGRIVFQDILRIHNDIESGKFFENPAFKKSTEHAKKFDSALHLIGLASDGGVHSHLKHLYALLKLAKRENLAKVYIHAFLDGRDTPPSSALGYIRDIQNKINRINPKYKIVAVSGRLYGMDRNKNWERTVLAFNAIVKAEGHEFQSAEKAVQHFYDKGVTDEFIEPCVISAGVSKNTVKSNDSIIFFNFRADRMRQITALFINKQKDILRHNMKNLQFTSMSQYSDDNEGFAVAYYDEPVKNHLSQVLSHYNIVQFKIAETEKYAHLTYFFNGGAEDPCHREERFMVPSPRVKNFSETPRMATGGVTEEVIKRIQSGKFPFVAINYSNADMIGHTGNIKATIEGLEFMDSCLEKVVKLAKKNNYTIIVTSDHGNAEEMYNFEAGDLHTAHTLNKVPFIIISEQSLALKKNGALANVAPTILDLMNLEKPKEMTAGSLLMGRPL